MTERQSGAMDALLLESEERYRVLIENASDIILSVRPDGSFEFVNKAFYDLLGFQPDDLASMTIWDVLHPDSIEECQVHLAAAMKGESVPTFRTQFMDKAGNAVPVEGNAHSRSLNGEVVATHSFFRDVSERLRAEELEAQNEQLEREQQARYLEKMAALGKLSAGLSHELNNPAAAAQRSSKRLSESLSARDNAAKVLTEYEISRDAWSNLETLVNRCIVSRLSPIEMSPLDASRLEDDLLDWMNHHGISDPWNFAPSFVQGSITSTGLVTLSEALPTAAIPAAVAWVGESLAIEEHADVIDRSMHRISELVGAVKQYSFRDQAIEQDVDIHDGLENTLVILAYQLRDVSIQRDYDRSLPRVRTYGSGLNQVWTNILDNAVDANDGKGTIRIRTTSDGTLAVVEITDNGPGIPQEHVSRVFEPFYTTKPQGEGTGLGLDITWRVVVDEHGGSISVSSVPGETTFRVAVPICPDDLQSED